MKKITIGMFVIIILCSGCDSKTTEIDAGGELLVTEEQQVELIWCDSIDQLEIQGRTQEETELIHRILSEDKEEFQEFLTTDWEFSHEMESVSIGGYDFTGDGKDEIIKSFGMVPPG